MKHIAQIQKEFLKMSASLATTPSWDSRSYEYQKKYLEHHPESRLRITARPPTGKYLAQHPSMEKYMGDIDDRRQQLSDDLSVFPTPGYMPKQPEPAAVPKPTHRKVEGIEPGKGGLVDLSA